MVITEPGAVVGVDRPGTVMVGPAAKKPPAGGPAGLAPPDVGPGLMVVKTGTEDAPMVCSSTGYRTYFCTLFGSPAAIWLGWARREPV